MVPLEIKITGIGQPSFFIALTSPVLEDPGDVKDILFVDFFFIQKGVCHVLELFMFF